MCLFSFADPAHAEDVVDFAARFIGRPYVWGAEGPNSFDCSGLTQYAYQEFGVELPRRAIDQSRSGSPAGRRLQRGDLLFFSTDTRQSLVTHVGLYEGNGMMIEASKRHGRVRRDSVSNEYWADRFMFARRFAPAGEDADRPDRRTGRAGDRPRGPVDRRRVAIRVIEEVAGALFKLPRR